MEENTWKRGQKHSYTGRPLTDSEKEFAGLKENHDLICKFCNIKRLNASKWYDILTIPYLEAVKQFVTEQPERQQYGFQKNLFFKLNTAVMNHNRAIHRKKRMPEGGFISLDMMVENNKKDSESRIEAWWIDPSVDIEKQFIRQENHKEFCENFNQFIEVLNQRIENHEWMAEELKTCVECLIKGRTKKQALRAANKDKERRKGRGCSSDRGNYTFTYIYDEYEEYMLDWDLEELRKVFREIFGC